MMTIRTITARSVPSPGRPIVNVQGLDGWGDGLAAARPTYEPILRASQAGGLCAPMDELRRLGALGPQRWDFNGETSAWAGPGARATMTTSSKEFP